jgi:hypothetical protein
MTSRDAWRGWMCDDQPEAHGSIDPPVLPRNA